MKYSKNIFSIIAAATIMAACTEDSSQAASSGAEISFSIEPAAQTRSAEASADVESKMAVCQGDTFYLKTEVRQMDEMPVTTTTTRGATKVASDLQSDGFVVSAYNTSDGTTRGTSYFEFLTATYADSKFTPQDAGTAKYWPKGKLMFYAYYPKYTASNGITQGTDATTLTYSVPSSPANHPDLMTAKQTNQQYTSGGTGTASLTFNHALCAIQFQTGSDLLTGTITGITFKNIYTDGTYNLDTDTWSSTTTGDQSFTGLSVSSIHGTANTNILANTQTLMMIPQTFTETSSIIITITDLDGTSHSMTFSLDGTSWTKGNKIVYTVNSSSLTTYLRNPLYYVAKYYLNSSKTFETTGGEEQYLWKQATMMTTKFAAQSSSYDGYQIPSGEHSINGVPYHMPTANEWYSIFPFESNFFSTTITGGTVQTEGSCTFGADSSTKTAKAYKSYWNTYVSDSYTRYGIRFLGTKYCSVWRYRNIGTSAAANRALEITAVLIDPIAETATSQLSTKMTQLTNGTFAWPTFDNYTTGAFVRVFYVAGFAPSAEGISTSSIAQGVGTDGFMPSTTTHTTETTSSAGPRYGTSHGTNMNKASMTNGRPIRLFRDY